METGQANIPSTNRRDNVFPTDAGNEQHRATDGGKQNGCATVGFNKNQTEYQSNEDARQNDAAYRRVHVPLAMVSIPCQQNDKRDFPELGRLKAHAVKMNQRRAPLIFLPICGTSTSRSKNAATMKIGQASFLSN